MLQYDTYVVLLILTSIWVHAHPKSWSKYFFSVFNLFDEETHFLVIFIRKQKNLKKHRFFFSVQLVVTQMLVNSLRAKIVEATFVFPTLHCILLVFV